MPAIASRDTIVETLLDGNDKKYVLTHHIVRWSPKPPSKPIEVEYEGKGKWSGCGFYALTT